MTRLLIAASMSALLMAGSAWAQSTSKPQSLSQQDKAFIDKAADSGMAEAMLGQLAQQKASMPAVKEFGRWMAADHSLAGKLLSATAQSLGYQHSPMLTEKDKALQQELQKLGGAEFDQKYVQAMVQDHKQAVSLFEAEAQGGGNSDLKALAQDLLPGLQQHLAEAEELANATHASTVGSANP
ncbi:MAG TPA: DUF4142 domain-containing protein [Dongiaceae bacterium]|nr:DUF4142 domain-containing protein [Dongiaceae bacterium]